MLSDQKQPQPLVSIITPTYNSEKYVAKTIESILGQSYTNYEYYIVDDGSTDRTRDIIEQTLSGYSTEVSARVHYIPHLENTGFAWHNEILPVLTGSYICIIAGDDMCSYDRLEKQVSFLESHPEYAGCFTWVNASRGDAGVNEFMERLFNVTNQSRESYLKRLLATINFFNAPSMMLRMEVYREYKGFNYKYRQSQDYDLWTRILLDRPLYIIPEKLTTYTVHSDSLSAPDDIKATCLFSRETEEILCNAFLSISDDLFLSIYREELAELGYDPSSNLNSLDVQCLKILLLMNMDSDIHPIVAARLFYRYADDDSFCQLLRNKYGYTRSDIHKMIKDTNLYAASAPTPQSDTVKLANELMRMLESPANSVVTEQHISALYQLCSQSDNGSELFVNTIKGLYNSGVRLF